MFRELEIEGFRCFKKLKVSPLGRVNLIVGKNNSGKTALLDAVEIVTDEQPTACVGGLLRRNEVSGRVIPDPNAGLNSAPYLIRVANLFHGYQLARFSIVIPPNRSVDISVGSVPHRSGKSLLIRRPTKTESLALTYDSLLAPPESDSVEKQAPVFFLGTERPASSFLSGLWDGIMLTDDEPFVIEALQLIDPRVERLAFKGEEPDRSILIKLKGQKTPLLLGSLGDGMRHLLALALYLVTTKGGYLLIDEIDTGLHHSVMSKMWRLVIETARRLDIQVFATTHSYDCIAALASVQDELKLTPDDLMVHRLEPELDHTITYRPEEIAVAVEHQIEVR